MSHLDSEKPAPFGLESGVTVYAVLALTREHLGRRQVVYDVEALEGKGRLTIGLDPEGMLRAWLEDARGRHVSTGPLSPPTLRKAFLLMVRIEPMRRPGLGIRTALRINDQPPQEDVFNDFKRWTSRPSATRIGASLDGTNESASFTLGRLTIFHGAHDEEVQNRIWTNARSEYAIG